MPSSDEKDFVKASSIDTKTGNGSIIKSLEVIRGVAALSVVLTHAEIHLPAIQYAGVVGVDVFFVLSGFLMLHTFHKDRAGIKFLIHRIIRIYPIYIIISFPLIVTYFPFINDKDKLSFLFHNITLLPGVSNSYERANIASWTLMYELYFYVVFSLVSAFSKNKMIIFSCVSLLLFSLFIYSRYNYSLGVAGWADLTLKNIFGNYILLDFMAGMLIGLLYRHIARVSQNIPAVFTISVSLILYLLTCINVTSELPSGFEKTYQSYVMTHSSLPAAIIILLLVMSKVNSQGWLMSKFCYLGKCSYSIYLCHVYFVSENRTGVKYFLDYFIIHTDYIFPYFSNFLLVIISSIAGILLYERVEKPFMIAFHARWR